MEREEVTNIKAGWLYLLAKEPKLYKTAKRRYFVFSKVEARATTLLRLHYYKDLVAYKKRDVPKGVIDISHAQYIGIGLEKMGKYGHLITIELPGKEMHLSASCCEDRFHWCIVLRAYRFNDKSRMASSRRILPSSRSVQDLGPMYRTNSLRTIRSDSSYTTGGQAKAEYWDSNFYEDSMATKNEISNEIIRKRLVYCKECLKKTTTIKDNMDYFTNYVLPRHDAEPGVLKKTEVDEHDYEEILDFRSKLGTCSEINSSGHYAVKCLDERDSDNIYVPIYKYPVNRINNPISNKSQINVQSPASGITEDVMKIKQSTCLSQSELDIQYSPKSSPDIGSDISYSIMNFAVPEDAVFSSAPIHEEVHFKKFILTMKAGNRNTRTLSEDRLFMGNRRNQETTQSTCSTPPLGKRLTPVSTFKKEPKQRIQQAVKNPSSFMENSSSLISSKEGDLDHDSVNPNTPSSNKSKARTGIFRNLVAVSVIADV